MTGLLARFRGEWLDGPLPMIVEYAADAPENICAAPSLWMGGRLVAKALAAEGIGPGDRVSFAGLSRVCWVQTLIGSLRRSACFDCSNEPSARARAQVIVDDRLELTITSTARGSVDAGARLAFDGDVTLSEADIEALAVDARALLDGSYERVATHGEWGDWRVFACEVLGPLCQGREIHVVSAQTRASQLEEQGSLPQFMTRRTRRRWAHDPLFSRELELCIAFDDDDDDDDDDHAADFPDWCAAGPHGSAQRFRSAATSLAPPRIGWAGAAG